MPLRAVTGAAVGVALILGASACAGSDDKSEADIKKELSATLRGDESSGLDTDTADCFAQAIIDEVGVERLRDVDLSADAPPPELATDIAAAAATAAEKCSPG